MHPLSCFPFPVSPFGSDDQRSEKVGALPKIAPDAMVAFSAPNVVTGSVSSVEKPETQIKPSCIRIYEKSENLLNTLPIPSVVTAANDDICVQGHP